MRSTNNLQAVLDLLRTADAITVDDGPLLSDSDVSDVTGDADNEVVYLSWVDDEGLLFGCKLTEGGIAAGKWVGTKFVCEDHDGQPTVLRFFRMIPMSAGGEG